MVYIPRYGWYVILGLSVTVKQREDFEIQFCKWCEKWENVVLREKVILVYEFKHGQACKIWP